MNNPAIQAWIDASEDLGFRFVHPHTFTTKGGRQIIAGGWLPDFGSPLGALIITRFDSQEASDGSEDTDYFISGLNPAQYEPYCREVYVETLNDWGWFGPEEQIPSWFKGGIRRHGGAD